MRRLIKFRAYNTREKIMETPDKILNNIYSDVESDSELDCYILMQFTGVIAEKGEEVFEGDLIKYWHPYLAKTYTCVVKWDDRFAGFSLFNFDGFWQESDWVKVENIEVIGNIYEHSHLLEVDNV